MRRFKALYQIFRTFVRKTGTATIPRNGKIVPMSQNNTFQPFYLLDNWHLPVFEKMFLSGVVPELGQSGFVLMQAYTERLQTSFQLLQECVSVPI